MKAVRLLVILVLAITLTEKSLAINVAKKGEKVKIEPPPMPDGSLMPAEVENVKKGGPGSGRGPPPTKPAPRGIVPPGRG
jgi:hypothetical protein